MVTLRGVLVLMLELVVEVVEEVDVKREEEAGIVDFRAEIGRIYRGKQGGRRQESSIFEPKSAEYIGGN